MRTHLYRTLPILLLLLSDAARGQSSKPVEEANDAPAKVDYWRDYRSQSFFSGPSAIDRVVVDIGTIGLTRETPDRQVIAEDENGDPIQNADTLQGSMQFGTKATLDFREVCSWFGGTDLQLGYFGINSLDATSTANASRVRSVFFQAYPLNPPTSADYDYSSNLYSGEANLRFGGRNRVRPIVGLRYFKLEDTYNVLENSSGNRGGFFSLTNNSLFGGQIGLEGDLWRTRRVSLYGFGKVAAMHNEIEGSATASNAHRDFTDSTYTNLVDAGTGASIHFAGPLSFRVGYRSLFASALALGIDQNGAIPILPGPGSVKFNSQHWHGIDLAAVFQF